MRLDRLFREEETLSDLAVDETVRHELEHFDLPRRWVLPLLSSDLRRKRDDRPVPARATTRRGRLEPATVVAITAQDLLTLSGVHTAGIGAPGVPL
jgi:hypothetical protein